MGEWVLAIGSPFGFDHVRHRGHRVRQGPQPPPRELRPVHPDRRRDQPRKLRPAPLFNLDGQVVGVNSQIFSRTGGFMGLSFAIPIDVAMDVADQLREKGRVFQRLARRPDPGRDQGARRVVRNGQAPGRPGRQGARRESRREGGVRGRRHRPVVRRTRDRAVVGASADRRAHAGWPGSGGRDPARRTGDDPAGDHRRAARGGRGPGRGRARAGRRRGAAAGDRGARHDRREEGASVDAADSGRRREQRLRRWSGRAGGHTGGRPDSHAGQPQGRERRRLLTARGRAGRRARPCQRSSSARGTRSSWH